MARSDTKKPARLQDIKAKLIGALLKGLSEEEMFPILDRYAQYVQANIRSSIMQVLLNHLANDLIVVVVTASPRVFVEHFFVDIPVTVLGTEFEVINQCFTGKVSGHVCFGNRKVSIISQWANTQSNQLKFIEAWSDSWSDEPMMKLAESRYWICPPGNAFDIQSRDPTGKIVDAWDHM